MSSLNFPYQITMFFPPVGQYEMLKAMKMPQNLFYITTVRAWMTNWLMAVISLESF